MSTPAAGAGRHRDGPAQALGDDRGDDCRRDHRRGRRFANDRGGYDEMQRYAAQWPDRVWAIEGCAGIGKHIAVRLLADGEEVVDVPPKLSARARVFATGQGRKTDATDARTASPWSAPG